MPTNSQAPSPHPNLRLGVFCGHLLDALLFVSFFNLLSLLPLFGAFRLGEFMGGFGATTMWEHLISLPWLLCLGVVIAAGYLARRVADSMPDNEVVLRLLSVNVVIQLGVWVVPGLLELTDVWQRFLIELWTIGSGLVLLISSLYVPIKAMVRIMLPREPGA